MFSFDPSVNSCGFRGWAYLFFAEDVDVTRHELAVRRNLSYVKSDSIRLAVVRRTIKVLL